MCAVSFQEVAELARELPCEPRVIALDPKTLEETLLDVGTLAEATGRRGRGVELVLEAERRIDAVRLAVEAQPRPRVAALEWLDPVYAAGHWTPQLIDLAGGQDVLGFAGAPSQVVSWEAVAAAEPEVAILMPCGYDAQRARAEASTYARELAGLNAGRVVAVNASAYFSRPGPRLIDGLELLAHILHPGRSLGAGGGPRAGLLGAARSVVAGREVLARGPSSSSRPRAATRSRRHTGGAEQPRGAGGAPGAVTVRRADHEARQGAADQAADMGGPGRCWPGVKLRTRLGTISPPTPDSA